MKLNAYYNGIFANKNNISIPLCDRAIFFGDGIYDAAIGRNDKIFMLNEHLDRFFKNALSLNLPLPYTREEVIQIFRRLISCSEYETFFLYFQLTRFSPERTHSYQDTDKSNLLITITPIEISSPAKSLNLIVREDKRYKFCNIKTLNLLPAVIASREAQILGADETVFSRNGIITECAHSNVHIIRNGILITHPLDEYILPGIARAQLLSICNTLNIEVQEREFCEEELFEADEILVTSSSKLCLRAKAVEDKSFKIRDDSVGGILCYEMFRQFEAYTL